MALSGLTGGAGAVGVGVGGGGGGRLQSALVTLADHVSVPTKYTCKS